MDADKSKEESHAEGAEGSRGSREEEEGACDREGEGAEKRGERGSRFRVPGFGLRGTGLRGQDDVHRQTSRLRRDGVAELAAVVLKRTLTGVEDGKHAEALPAVGDGLTT